MGREGGGGGEGSTRKYLKQKPNSGILASNIRVLGLGFSV